MLQLTLDDNDDDPGIAVVSCRSVWAAQLDLPDGKVLMSMAVIATFRGERYLGRYHSTHSTHSTYVPTCPNHSPPALCTQLLKVKFSNLSYVLYLPQQRTCTHLHICMHMYLNTSVCTYSRTHVGLHLSTRETNKRIKNPSRVSYISLVGTSTPPER